MSQQLQRDVRAAFEADFEPSPQLADWALAAVEPKPSRGSRLTRLAAVVAAIAVVVSAGYYAVNYGLPRFLRPSPVGAPADDGQALSTGTFSSGSNGWIVKRAGHQDRSHPATTDVVYQTSDGGATWTERLRFKGEYDGMVFSADGGKGVVWALDNTAPFCSGPTARCGLQLMPAIVYRTADGGRTWLKMPTPKGSFYTGAFLNPEEGWLLTFPDGGTGNEEVDHTTDGGATWEVIGHVSFSGFNGFGVTLGTYSRSLVFADSLHGWLVPNSGVDSGTAALLTTLDGGRTWHGLTLELPAGSSGLVSANAPRLFGDGTGILPVTVQAPGPLPQGPEPPSTIYIYSTADGGLTWGNPRRLFPADSPQATETVVGIEGIWDFMDAKHWWVTNQTGTGGGPWAPRPHLLVTADGGRTWKTYDNSPNISDLFFVSPTTGWAEDQTQALFGNNINGLIRTTDGGAHWTRVQVPTVG
jgi:photosystem II stability/assembly factor-like uncharacterized protein